MLMMDRFCVIISIEIIDLLKYIRFCSSLENKCFGYLYEILIWSGEIILIFEYINWFLTQILYTFGQIHTDCIIYSQL